MMIQIDALKPQISDPAKVASSLQDRIENFMIADRRNQEKGEPPSYLYEEMVDRLVSGTYGSVTADTAEFLLKRNIRRSEKHPGKFYFTRDSRLKYNYSASYAQPVSVELAKRLNMPHLFIKAIHSPMWEAKQYYEEVLNVLKESKNFEHRIVDSRHHLHLTEPEKVAPIISEFILKHTTIKPTSKL